MNFQLENRDDLVLPPWIGKFFAFLVLIVALGLIYYGVHDGIINQEIAFRTKSGKVSIGKGVIAVVIGLAFSGIGVAIARVSMLIFKSSNTK